MSNTLLPCPFCGGEAKIKSRYIGYGSIGLGAHDWFSVSCQECCAKSDEYVDGDKAIAAWNRRTGKDINVATNNAMPVVRGEWIMDTDPDDGDCRCSNCHVCIDALHRRNHPILKAMGYKLHTFYKYCPNCGAKMDGEYK